MVKVVNRSKSRIWIGNIVIKPGETAELTEKEMEFSGVKVLLKAGDLKIVEEKKEKKRIKKK